MKKEMPKKSGSVGIYVAGPTKKSVRSVENAILRVIGTPGGDAVKLAAINAIVAAMSHPVGISNCSIGKLD